MANAASSSSPGGGRSCRSSLLPTLVALPEELVEEILLRIPPGEPASLLRAAIVCKRWRRLVSSPVFRRRFAELHRTPPMLGMICNKDCIRGSHFVPTTAFRARHGFFHSRALDSRHGRVLLLVDGKTLVVWDPITDEEWMVPFPRVPLQYTWAAAVLCSAAEAGGCAHLDCHRGPFTVVFVHTVFVEPGEVATAISTYSSDVAAWSDPTCAPQYDGCGFNPWMRSALVGNTLYFGILNQRTALKYNVQLRQMSCIHLPPSMYLCPSTLLTTTEDGGLLLATEHKSKLYVWLRKDANEVDAIWEQSRVVELKMLLPVDAFTSLDVVGSTDDLGIIFMRADDVVYEIDLKTCKGKKVYEGRVEAIVPFMSFYTPELKAAYANEGPSDEIGSNA